MQKVEGMNAPSTNNVNYEPRHQFWRRSYRQWRYARHLSQTELNARIRDIVLNFLRVTPDGKISFPPISDESIIWIEKFTHMLEEMQMRHGPYPSGFTRDIVQSEPLPALASDLAERAARKMSSMGLRRGDVFIKFGKREHMETLFEKGTLRIQPASYFRNKDHNGALRDDELSLSFSVALSRDDVVKLVVNKNDVPEIIPEQRVDAHYKSNFDFLIYCVTSSVEPRLFLDFNAEACVIIKDRTTFREKLRSAGERHLGGATMKDGAAIYLDPVLPTVANVFVPFAKHFRYLYQDEYRFCWLPPIPSAPLSYVDVCLGSLRGIADLVVL